MLDNSNIQYTVYVTQTIHIGLGIDLFQYWFSSFHKLYITLITIINVCMDWQQSLHEWVWE